MAHKNKDRKSKTAHTKDEARSKTFNKHPNKGASKSESGYESKLNKSASESMDEGKRSQIKRGGRHCPNC